jgi:xanthine dehydrogenase YagT iron-sulfur-binding subunit
VTEDLTSVPELTRDEVAERMSGNLCRCGAYAHIVPAVQQAGGVMP